VVFLPSAGIPQIVLPVWMDTYDFARRAEILGIGRWGNRYSATEWKVCKGKELGSVLVDVLVGGRASLYTRRAKELAELCKRSGGGRVVAARYILGEIERGDGDDGCDDDVDDEGGYCDEGREEAGMEVDEKGYSYRRGPWNGNGNGNGNGNRDGYC